MSTALSESRHLYLSWAHLYLSWALALQGWRVLYRESGQGPQGTEIDGNLFVLPLHSGKPPLYSDSFPS